MEFWHLCTPLRYIVCNLQPWFVLKSRGSNCYFSKYWYNESVEYPIHCKKMHWFGWMNKRMNAHMLSILLASHFKFFIIFLLIVWPAQKNVNNNKKLVVMHDMVKDNVFYIVCVNKQNIQNPSWHMVKQTKHSTSK